MDYAAAVFIREVEHGERVADLIEEARARTYVQQVEVAVLKIEGNRRLMVGGGRDGITFERGSGEADEDLFMDLDGRKVRVLLVYGHTHPRATGPSDGDLKAIAVLRQTKSYIFELGGERRGTLIRPKPPRPSR